MITGSWLIGACEQLAERKWPERIDGPDSFLTVSYQSGPMGMVATLHGWDDDARGYELEIDPGIVVPLDKVQVLL
jgi:hypothetical protein